MILVYVIAFLIGLAISTATLTISLIVFARIWGASFGDAKVAIAKGAGLLLVVNVLALIPLGCFTYLIVLVVWFVGLMVLYELRFLEAFLLTIVNLAVNIVVGLLLQAMLFPLIAADRPAEDLDGGFGAVSGVIVLVAQLSS